MPLTVTLKYMALEGKGQSRKHAMMGIVCGSTNRIHKPNVNQKVHLVVIK